MTAPHVPGPAACSPALVLLYGTPGASLVRKLLDRDAVILGKSRGCDLLLDAPDVSGVHCVVSRTAGGFSIRDCGSRAGTRLNGERVEEATLRDGDLVQVGPFSFRAALPPPRPDSPGQVSEPRHLRLDRKRRNLIRLALVQRRRIRDLQAALMQGKPSQAARQARVPGSGLRRKTRDLFQRLQELEQSERDLTRDRELLAREQRAFHCQVQAVEADLARRGADLGTDHTPAPPETAESIL